MDGNTIIFIIGFLAGALIILAAVIIKDMGK